MELVSRRIVHFNVTESANYDVDSPFENHTIHNIWNQLVYRTKTKRCSLWRYVQDEDRIAFVFDLPSRNNTCFASMI